MYVFSGEENPGNIESLEVNGGQEWQVIAQPSDLTNIKWLSAAPFNSTEIVVLGGASLVTRATCTEGFKLNTESNHVSAVPFGEEAFIHSSDN